MAYSYPVDNTAFTGANFTSNTSGEGGGHSDFQLLSSVSVENDYQPIRSITFDPYEELIWTCSDSGRLSAHFDMLGPHKYISVGVSKRPLCDLTVNHPSIDNGVFVLDDKNLYYYTKTGQCRKKYSHALMLNLVCSLYRPHHNQMCMSGRQNNILCMDTNTGDVVLKANVGDSGCVIMKESRHYVCAGAPDGKITLFDPHSLSKPVREFQAHTGQLSDMTVQENLLITCGWSMRQNGTIVPDRLLKVYDLRFGRSMKPISMMAFDPCFVRFDSLLYNSLLVISSFGHYQFLDIGNTMANYQYNSSPIAGNQVTDIALSASCRVMAISDDVGCLYLFSPDSQPQINRSVIQPEIPESPINYTLGPLGFDEYQYPLSAIPFGFPKTDTAYPLTSDWPEELLSSRHFEPAPIEQEVLDSVQVKKGLRLARKPAHWGRVHFPYRLSPKEVVNSGQY